MFCVINFKFITLSPGGMSSDCLTPTSHLSLSSTSLTAHTPTQQMYSTTHTPRTSITDPTPPVLTSISPQRVTSTQDRSSSTQQSYMSESPLPRHPVAVLQHSQGPSGVPLMSGTNTVLVPMQQPPPVIVSTSPHILSHDARPGQVVYSQGITLLNARDVIVSPTSPTSIVSNSSPTLMGPNTTHGSYIMGPANQLIGPYSPIPTYPYSPSASPILSPKTPKMYGSYNAVNHPPSEQDSLIQWLKSLRLHKYYNKFENVTFDEVRFIQFHNGRAAGIWYLVSMTLILILCFCYRNEQCIHFTQLGFLPILKEFSKFVLLFTCGWCTCDCI